jgi:hypothetical protein
MQIRTAVVAAIDLCAHAFQEAAPRPANHVADPFAGSMVVGPTTTAC